MCSLEGESDLSGVETREGGREGGKEGGKGKGVPVDDIELVNVLEGESDLGGIEAGPWLGKLAQLACEGREGRREERRVGGWVRRREGGREGGREGMSDLGGVEAGTWLDEFAQFACQKWREGRREGKRVGKEEAGQEGKQRGREEGMEGRTEMEKKLPSCAIIEDEEEFIFRLEGHGQPDDEGVLDVP